MVLFGGSVDGEDRIFVRFLKVSPSSRFRIRILLFRMMVSGAVSVEGVLDSS